MRARVHIYLINFLEKCVMYFLILKNDRLQSLDFNLKIFNFSLHNYFKFIFYKLILILL